jgi:hypothetical protein
MVIRSSYINKNVSRLQRGSGCMGNLASYDFLSEERLFSRDSAVACRSIDKRCGRYTDILHVDQKVGKSFIWLDGQLSRSSSVTHVH